MGSFYEAMRPESECGKTDALVIDFVRGQKRGAGKSYGEFVAWCGKNGLIPMPEKSFDFVWDGLKA